MAIPKTITRGDMLEAIEMIDTGRYVVPSIRRSRGYCLEYDGKNFSHFPPKEVVRQAYALRNGTELWDFGGGKETNNFCRSRGFAIVENCGGAPH